MTGRAEFERSWPWLEAAADSKTHSKEHIWHELQRGARLWPGYECAALTNILTFPTGLRVCNIWLAGGDLDELRNMATLIENTSNCDRAMINGRRGWLKALPGYREYGTRMCKELR